MDYPSPGSGTNEPQSRQVWEWASRFCRYSLAVLFLMAGVSKIMDPRGFETQVLWHSDWPHWIGKAASIVPGLDPTVGFKLAKPMVVFLPWLELTCGLCLVFGWAVREAALTTAVLLIVFIAASITSRTDDCHCLFVPFAFSKHLPWWSYALRDAIVLIFALVVVLVPVGSKPEPVTSSAK